MKLNLKRIKTIKRLNNEKKENKKIFIGNKEINKKILKKYLPIKTKINILRKKNKKIIIIKKYE